MKFVLPDLRGRISVLFGVFPELLEQISRVKFVLPDLRGGISVLLDVLSDLRERISALFGVFPDLREGISALLDVLPSQALRLAYVRQTVVEPVETTVCLPSGHFDRLNDHSGGTATLPCAGGF